MENRTKEIKLMFRVTDAVARKFKAQCALRKETMQDALERITMEYLQSAEEKSE
ncbi:MAG: hypothetical protein IJ667_12495 [Synergistaceae bacterium]|nr:hypothetical protein [Synergistaceae bacterium]